MNDRVVRTLFRLVALAALGLASPPLLGQMVESEPSSTGEIVTEFEIVEIRLHGNHRLQDDEILQLAGVAVGDRKSSSEIATLESRLRASGRFDDVSVEHRYRSMTRRDRVVLLITVRENVPAASKFLIWPEIHYNEDDHFSVGARVGARDLLGGGELISLPATLGGVDQMGLEISRTWTGGFGLGGAYRLRGRENPHFEVRDIRSGADLWATQPFGSAFRLRLEGTHQNVEFAGTDDRLWRYGANLVYDTRPSRVFPHDALLASVGWQRVDPDSGPSANRYRFELAGYRTLVGRLVLAARGLLHTADGPLPDYERPYVGGMVSLRGYRAGTFVGDSAALGTVEVRLPLGSAQTGSIARVGISAFWDAGAAWSYGQSLGDQKFHQGVGVGVFLTAPLVRLNLDVANDLHGNTRLHFGTGFRF